jgi:transcriptional regulator with XRE-family HTH domain
MSSTPDGDRPDPAAERHWICARRLRERRRALGLTQAAVVARLARCGAALTNRTLSAMENGRGLDLARLPDLAAALDCSVTYLVGLTTDPERWEPDAPFGATGGPGAVPVAVETPEADGTGAGPATPHHWILGPDPLPWSALR